MQRKVDKLKGLYPKDETGVSPWFSYVALLGENMRDETVAYHRPSVRLLIAIWVIPSFLLSAGYAGVLKGFLTNPGLTPKIKTLQQVKDSGLPYYWNDYRAGMKGVFHPNKLVVEIMKTSLQTVEGSITQETVLNMV